MHWRCQYNAHFHSVSLIIPFAFCFVFQSYDKESASVSDKENNLFVNFLHDLNQKDGDLHSQPGADVKFYLRDLKRRARFVLMFTFVYFNVID